MNEALWTRVQSALDERREPLADEDVRAWLLEHPEDALALGDVRAAIFETERADNPLRARRRSRRVPVAAAALVLVALAAWLAIPARTAAEELQLHPIVAAPALGSVQSWIVVSTVETAQRTQTVRASEGCIAIEDDLRAQASREDCVLAMRTEGWTHR